MSRYFVTGGAGFIGSHVVDRLLADGHQVTVYDNLSTGRMQMLSVAATYRDFRFIHGDLLDVDRLNRSIVGHDFVFHLAANADIRGGVDAPRRDLEQNTIATHNVLEAMRTAGIRRMAFSSTSAIYGDAEIFPTPENCPLPIQTSLYGASKIACEGLVSSYCLGFGFEACIFRFVSIVGERYSHGHVFDFYKKLLTDSTRITVLGDGKQRKSYLYVQDCVDAVMLATSHMRSPVAVYNLGHEEVCMVDDSLSYMCESLGIRPRRDYTGGERGWTGDSPFILLDTTKIRSLGWRPKLSIREGLARTLVFLQENPWILQKKDDEPQIASAEAA